MKNLNDLMFREKIDALMDLRMRTDIIDTALSILKSLGFLLGGFIIIELDIESKTSNNYLERKKRTILYEYTTNR